MLPPSLLLGLAIVGLRHTPHDDAHDVAIGIGPAGETAVVVAGNSDAPWLWSGDHGLSWSPLSGDGLERPGPTAVEYWADPLTPRFLLGTEQGVWSWEPTSGAIQRISKGLAAGARRITDLRASVNGQGPPFAVTAAGAVYRWNEAGQTWTLVLDTGHADDHAKLAVAPAWASAGTEERDRMVCAGIAGQLHISFDGGDTWRIQKDFRELATESVQWRITSLAAAADYRRSGVIVLGRGRDEPSSSTGKAGEIWRSANGGYTFRLAAETTSPVRSLATSPTPPGGGEPVLFAVPERHPHRLDGRKAEGVFRSVDGGRSWADAGSAQDFLIEFPETASIDPRLRGELGVAVSPDFWTNGIVFLARAEGLFRSRDEGRHWTQVTLRLESQVRELDTGLDAGGSLVAFGGTYGAGLARYSAASGVTDVLVDGKILYGRPVAVSPNFATDGTVGFGGSAGFAFWFDPAAGGMNPYFASGWMSEEPNPYGYVKTLSLSPRFDASDTVAGSDQQLMFSSRDGAIASLNKTYASLNAAQEVLLVDTIVGGGDLPHLEEIEPTPNYEPGAGTGQIYAKFSDVVARFVRGEWESRIRVGAGITSIAVDPAYDDVSNTRVFVATSSAPYLGVVDDAPAGATFTAIDAGPFPGRIQEMVAGTTPTGEVRLYVVTWGLGVWSVDPDSPTPAWQQVGIGFPDVFAEGLGLSPDFANDRTIVAGTQRGFAIAQDVPGAAWTLHETPQLVDDEQSSLRYSQPAAPFNPQPDRAWLWALALRREVEQRFGVTPLGRTAAFTPYAGSKVECEGIATTIELCTVRGPFVGGGTLRVLDWESGAVLVEQTYDFDHTAYESHCVSLSVAAGSKVRVEFETIADPGEVVVFDAFRLVR